MAAYKIISAVIPERVDDSSSDRYLVVAPQDKIVWIATDKPTDLSPQGRKQAVHDAGLMSLLSKIKREENGVESDSCSDADTDDRAELYLLDEDDYLDEYEDDIDYVEYEEAWEKEKH
ncbi:MAG: hypothetical protein ACYC5A_09125 [Thermoleophilia bacterium]